jgi:sterol desaturase/sphingolipid hydroxylase (fatty acid hydroxylase superfamily)
VSRVLDHAVFPIIMIGSYVAAVVLLAQGVPPLFVTPIVVGPMAAILVLLERVRPEKADSVPFDLPLWMEAAHFVLDFELGYGIALAACAGVELLARRAFAPLWPTAWPVLLQVILAVVFYEATSYWQHRALHRVPGLFRFHALHHSGGRLNMVRAVRFHMTDFATASFVAYLPLVLLGAPEPIVTLMAVAVSALGALQHCNTRMRTPWWLDRLVCTPAVHRHHHSIVLEELDRNFGNSVMIFDLLFGTFAAPRPDAPAIYGIDPDPVPRASFLGQWLGPLGLIKA